MEKQFKFNEDVGGLFINVLIAYVTILFTLGIGRLLGQFVDQNDGRLTIQLLRVEK